MWDILRVIGSLALPGGRRGRLSILIYHRVLEAEDPLKGSEVDKKTFSWQVDMLARQFNVLPLSEALTRLSSGTLPTRSVCITFDDGYADNAEVALPILRSAGVSATFFVATAFMDGGLMWNDAIIEAVRRTQVKSFDLRVLGLGVHRPRTLIERRLIIKKLLETLKYLPPKERSHKVGQVIEPLAVDLPRNLMMSSQQLRDLAAADMEIGAHTANHPILKSVDDEDAMSEIVESKRHLEALLGKPISLFSYPNGRPGKDYDRQHVAMVKRAGFKAAVSTAWGVASNRADYYQLPRFTPWDRTERRFALRLMHNAVWGPRPAEPPKNLDRG